MKKSFSLLFVLFLAIGWCTSFGQSMEPSNGAIPNLKLERIHTIVNPSQNPATIAYGYAGIAANTISMPIPAGTPFTVLAPWVQPAFASSMIKGPNGLYYMTEIAPALYQFDPGSGAVTLLGIITGMGADQPNGISYNPANGTYPFGFITWNLGTLPLPANPDTLLAEISFVGVGCFSIKE